MLTHLKTMQEALSRATVLEMVGDLPNAEAKPPDEVLFVCKLNAVTQEEDLEVCVCVCVCVCV
jgi:peptidyl-prolyl cis-trans isomerase-like 4